jgi:membrane protein DedA with SNARE-associated domain
MLYSFLGSALWAFAGVFAGNILTQYLGDRAIPVILLILVVSIIAVGVQQALKARKK